LIETIHMKSLLAKHNLNSKIIFVLTGAIFTFLLVAVIVPSMLPGALANNIWSVQASKVIFNSEVDEKSVPLPPPYHPHASIWMSRQSLTPFEDQNRLPVVEAAVPQETEEPSLDLWLEGLTNYSDIQALDVEAKNLYQQGQYAEAIEIWTSINQKAALSEAAAEASSYGITSLAIQAYQALYAIDPEAYTLSLAGALQNSGDSESAIDVLQAVLQAFPFSREKPRWLIRLGDICRAQNDWDKAEAAYQEVLSEDPAAVGAWIGLGWLDYQRDQDINETIMQFERAMAVDPKSGEGQAAMGNLFSQREEFEIAAEWYRVAYERDRDNLSYALSYAGALYSLGQTDQALAEYENLVTRFPDKANTFYHLAWVYHREGRSEEAVTAIETALSLIKIPNLSYYLRAKSIYEADNHTKKVQDLYQSAEENYQEGVRLFPDFPESHLIIANFYERFERIDQAITAYQAALALDPDNPMALAGLDRLEELDE